MLRRLNPCPAWRVRRRFGFRAFLITLCIVYFTAMYLFQSGLDRRGSRCGGANSDEGGKGESGEAFHSDFLRVAKRAAILNT